MDQVDFQVVKMSMDQVLEETYTRLAAINPELCKACMDKRYFVTSIEYYSQDRVPINQDGKRIDEPEIYILIDTTVSVDKFKSWLSFESYSTMCLKKFMDYEDKDYVRC